MREIRSQVFQLYGLAYEDDRCLIKAYYSFIPDKVFTAQVLEV